MIRSGQRNIQWARQAQEIILEAAVLANDPDAPMKLAILQNEIAQGEFLYSNEVEMELNDSENSVMNGPLVWNAMPI
jgi:hypothetical protein